MKASTITLAAAILLGLLAQPAFAQPDPALKPLYGMTTLKAGFRPDPYGVVLVSGNDIKTNLGGVNALVSQKPQHRLDYTAGAYPLSFVLKSKARVTLLVHQPDGTWIASDAAPDSLIRIAKPKSGAYSIFVGGANQDLVEATLLITELEFNTKNAPPPPQQGGTKEEQELFREVMERLLQTSLVRDNIPADISWPPVIRIAPNSAKVLNAHAGQMPIKGVLTSFAEITEGMMQKVKGDKNALAALMGHELVHLLKKHPGYQYDVVGSAIGREQELEADLEGIKIAVAAGYLEEGGAGFLKVFIENYGDIPHFPSLKVTHPSTVDRLQFLDRGRAHIWKAMAAYNNGVFFLGAEQYRSAESCFDAVTKAFPDSQEAWANLGYARLMQYCDALDEKDLRKLGIGQVAAGCFYFRPPGFVPTRGMDEGLWNSAVRALTRARDNDPDGKYVLARANLGLAYLVHPDGKPDVAKALAFFAEVENIKDPGMNDLTWAAFHINYAVAHQAAGAAEKARARLLQADKHIEKQIIATKAMDPTLTNVDGAYNHNHARLLASGTAEKKKSAYELLQKLLTHTGQSSAWWPIAYDQYAALGKELKLPVSASADLMKLGQTESPRFVADVVVAGKVITLADKTADVLTLLGADKKWAIPAFRNAAVHRYHEVRAGIDLLGGDRVIAIFLTSPRAPSVFVQMRGLGSEKKELRVGMSTLDFVKAVKGQIPAAQSLPVDAKGYVSYPNLGLAFRFADNRVQEIAILQVPYVPRAR